MSCGVGCRHDSDPVLLWLWRRPAVVAPIRPLAWEQPYATRAALKRKKGKEKGVINDSIFKIIIKDLRKYKWKILFIYLFIHCLFDLS